MIDGDENDFGLEDEETVAAQKMIGLAIPALPEGVSLNEAEERYRRAKRVLPVAFTQPEIENEYTGPDVWAAPEIAEEMRVVMGWPEGAPPTVAEWEAWARRRVAIVEWLDWQRLVAREKAKADAEPQPPAR